MEFDVRPILGKIGDAFTSRYMEAKVMEDFKLLNEITENYSLGYLSESCALTMLDILGKSEYRLMESAMEAVETLNDMTLEDALHIPAIHSFGFVGEGVMPYKEIVKANDGESIYNAYTFERAWDDSTMVGKIASEIANSKEANLKLFKESKGEKGFGEFERSMYHNYPDDRVESGFLYERVIDAKILSGSMSMEDGFMLKDFVSTRFAFGENASSMMPVISLTGENPEDKDLSTTNVKDMVASTDSEINDIEDNMNEPKNNETVYGILSVESVMDFIGSSLRSSGAFIALEGVIYKNNMIFDSECKKVFDKVKKHLRLSKPNDDQASFKDLLNVQKNRYTFNFSNVNVDTNEITAAIVGCGFKPIKENGIIVRYEKISKGIKITLEFTSVDNGIIIFYENNTDVVKESTLDEKIEFGLDCEASDVKDAAKKVKKLRSDKDTKKEDFEDAVNNLDHAIENFKEVQKVKEKEVKESAKDLLTSLRETKNTHYLVNEWMKESCLDNLPSDHPLFCKKREEISSIVSEMFVKENTVLCTESSDEFVNERKSYLINELYQNTDYVVTERTLGNYITGVLSNAPSMKVFESCYDVLEGLFMESVSDKVFKESVSKYLKDIKHQEHEEVICETVLNNIEFVEEVFTESSHDIDEDIKGVVELLNRLGYTVKYSCSGHNKTRIKEDNYRDGVYHGKLYTTARLTFDKKYDFKSIPNGWYENKNADKTSIYVRAFTYDEKDGTPNEAFEKWKASYMKALKDWVDNLDKAQDTNSDEKMESVVDKIYQEISSQNVSVPCFETPTMDFDDFTKKLMSDMM